MTTQSLSVSKPGHISPARLLFGLWHHPLALLTDMATINDQIAHIRVADGDLFLINHPQLARELLVTQHRCFVKGRALQRARRVLGDGLLTSEGALHLRQRRMLQPAFHRARVAGYGTTMAEYTARHSAGWQHGATCEITREMANLTLAIAGKTMFDADVTADAAIVGAALGDLMALFNLLTMPFSDLILRLPIPAAIRLRQAEQRLDTVIARLITERLASGDHGDILSMLLFSADEQGQAMSIEQVRDEALTLFLAGHETTANALSWTWWLLANNPGAEAQMHAEIDALGHMPTADDMPHLPYTRAVLSEAMRLFPPAWAIGRTAIEATEIGGMPIPIGATVLVSPYLMHRDPRFFAQPQSFDPSRWLTDQQQHTKHAYMPFGAGPRMCIGESFAWMEGVLILAVIAQRWRLRAIPGQVAIPQPSVTLRIRGGLRMSIEARTTELRN